MNPKLALFCRQNNVSIHKDGCVQTSGLLQLIYPNVDDSLLEKTKENTKVFMNGNGDCNVCPVSIYVPPQLAQKGWGTGYLNQYIFLFAINIEETDMPVGSFRVIFSDMPQVKICGRNYLPTDLGTDYFLESVHEDAENLIEPIKKQFDVFPEDPYREEIHGNDYGTSPVKVLGKLIGYRWSYSFTGKPYSDS